MFCSLGVVRRIKLYALGGYGSVLTFKFGKPSDFPMDKTEVVITIG